MRILDHNLGNLDGPLQFLPTSFCSPVKNDKKKTNSSSTKLRDKPLAVATKLQDERSLSEENEQLADDSLLSRSPVALRSPATRRRKVVGNGGIRLGMRFLKVRAEHSEIGFFHIKDNTNIPGNNGGPGKYLGNGNANARRSDGVGSSSGLNNTEQVKGVAKFKNNVPAKPSNAGKSNGSRFDVLNDEGDVLMVEGSSHICNIAEEGRKIKGKSVLTEVTNQNNMQGRKVNRALSQSSKNVAKKGIKKTNAVIHREVASFTKNMPSSDRDKLCSSSPIEPDPDIIDSASVLRQLHNKVTNFETQTSGMDGITVSLIQNDTSNNIVGVDKFETVASDLKEVLAMISE
ncbi:hypothetical protein Q3G72_024552 [Acer saccharum]|nr:hypothetical protein Q3G72_024552 [Acer saccharum]